MPDDVLLIERFKLIALCLAHELPLCIALLYVGLFGGKRQSFFESAAREEGKENVKKEDVAMIATIL